MDEEGKTEPQKMTVSGSININNKTKPTALVKRKKEKLIKCKPPHDKRFELHWDYTTNKSGSQEFTFTGKEMGEGFWSPETKNKLKIGDLVIFKKTGHQNNKYKARIYAKTGLISKVDALKNGIIQELPKMPDIYDIKFIAQPVINGVRKLKMKGISADNLEKIPGYRFFFCGTAKPNKEKEDWKEPDFIYDKGKLKSLVTLEMKKGFVKKLPWKIDMIEAKYTDIKKDPITGKNVPPEKVIDTPKNFQTKYRIAGVNLIEVSNPICINKGKEKEIHKLRAKVHIRLVKVEKGKPVTDAEGVMSVLDCKEHKRRALVKLDEIRKDFSDQAMDFADFIGDRLNQKYAKNQYGEMEWYQNKGKEEHLATIKRNKKRKENPLELVEEEAEPTEAQKAKETIKEWKNEGKADAHAETQRLKSSMGALKKGLEIEKEEKKEAEDAEGLATGDSGEDDPDVASIGGGKRKMSRRKKNKKRSCTKKKRRNRNK